MNGNSGWNRIDGLNWTMNVKCQCADTKRTEKTTPFTFQVERSERIQDTIDLYLIYAMNKGWHGIPFCIKTTWIEINFLHAIESMHLMEGEHVCVIRWDWFAFQRAISLICWWTLYSSDVAPLYFYFFFFWVNLLDFTRYLRSMDWRVLKGWLVK